MTTSRDKGFILINRGIIDHWIWQDRTKATWWLELIILANYEYEEVFHDSHKFILKRGQLIASAGYLANKWKVDVKTVTKFLNLCVENGMLKREILHRKTAILTICNYDRYQYCSSGSVGSTTESIVETITETITDGIVETITETTKRNKRNKRNISPKGESICARTSVEISPQEVVEAWNSICVSLPKVKVINDKRKKNIKIRLKEMGSMEKVKEVFRKIESSAYCTGSKGWKASFDWIIDNSSNWVKVDEGNYDNQPQTNKNEKDSKRSGAVAQSSSDFRLSF